MTRGHPQEPAEFVLLTVSVHGAGLSRAREKPIAAFATEDHTGTRQDPAMYLGVIANDDAPTALHQHGVTLT